MPPSRKVTAAKPSAAGRDRRSSSRHVTPASSALSESAPSTPVVRSPACIAPAVAVASTTLPKETPYLRTSTAVLISSEPSIEDLIAKTSAIKNDPPSARALHELVSGIREGILKAVGKRGEACERNLRQVVQKRKERRQLEQEQEAARAQADARKREREKERVKREKEEEGGAKKAKKLSRKRSRDEMEVAGEAEGKEGRGSISSVGAHVLARQDGVGVHHGAQPPPSSPIQPGTAAIDPMDTAASPSNSDASLHEPAATAPLYERAFGKDPSTFDDPTIYDIRPLTASMTDEEKREILNVAQWPSSDLRDLTAGDPPDQDFSNAKPANQVNFSAFQTYVEPYIRPFTEEDVAFLKERGDRLTPYIIPQRGPKGYKEVWAAEDGLTGIEPPHKDELDPNVARGSMEDMKDDVAETDEVSMGPVMNRLMSILRPASSGVKKGSSGEEDAEANGDTSMLNGDDSLQDLLNGTSVEQPKPVTYLPPDAPRPDNLPQQDYDTFETRALQELRYIGFITPTETPEFDSHNDDEVAARLRTLQHELKRVSTLNNVRKARVLELAEERMAMQEYSNIADDLDNQVNAAYLKRNRSLARPQSKKAAAASRVAGQKGVAGAAGVGGRGVSEGVRALMQKRRDWIEMVGPVVGSGRPPIPGDDETVFDEGNMKRLERAEREAEVGEGEGE